MGESGSRENGNPATISVLYVDDEPDLLEIAKIFLESTGIFTVTTMPSASEALKSPSFMSYDAIISDYQMPGMDGIDFLKAVRESRPGIPFILFTGRGREEVVVAAINNGADFYLQKGGDPKAQFAELAHKIRQAVARRRAEQERSETEKRLLDIINFLPDATFAIDRSFTVIAWNRAMEEMTGTAAAEVLGQGQEAYSRALYCETRPMLIDLVLAPDERFEKDKYLYTERDGTTLTAETILLKDGRPPAHLWGKASRLYDENGNLAGAIESIRDITQRKKAEEALRSSEEKYRLVVEKSYDGIYIIRDNQLLLANRTISELTGYTVAELQEIDMWSLIHPDDRARLQESGRRRIEGEDIPPNFTARLVTRNGDVRTCEFFVSRITYQNQPAILGILRDVTGQRKAEEARHLLKISVDQSPEEVIWLDFKGTILYVNDAACRINGYSREEFCSMTIFDLDPDLTPEIWGALVSNLREKKNGFLISRHRCRDGRMIDVEIVAVYVRQEEREYIFSFTRDITERRRIERSLRQSEATARALTRNPLIATALIDPDGICLDANETMAERYGKEVRDIIGKPVWALFSPENVADRKAFFARVFEEKRTLRETISRNGRWFENALNPILDENGNVTAVVTISLDITDQKKTEKALMENEQRFRGMAERSSDLIFVLNKGMSPVYVSPSAQQIIGYNPEELVGKPTEFAVRSIFSPSAREFMDGLEKNMQGLSVDNLEIEIRKKDNTPVFVNVHAVPILQDGIFAGAQVSMRDITAAKNAENALLESEAWFRSLVETSPDMIWEIDPEGRFRYISPMVTDIMGYSPQELAGGSILDLVSEEDRPFIAREFARYIALHSPLPPLEVPARHKDGRDLFLEVRPARMQNGNGEFTGFRGVVHDITKRKLAQAALKESEELFRVLISSVPDLVIRTDLDGTITYINDYGLAMGGFHSPQEIVGTPVFRWFAKEDLERVKENAKLMLERPLGPIEYTLIGRNGLRHALEINGDVLRAPDGNPYGMVFVGRDVTQRKKAEDAIRKAHQQITILSGITRHDILNNITVILGYLSFAKAKGNVPPEMTAFLEKIEEKTRQIREQIEFTRIYEDIGSTEPKWQDIHAVIQGVSMPQGVRITETCDGIEVYADVMLKTVFANLIDNSVRHGERVTEIRIAASEKEGRLVIIYEDNGAGIAEEEKEMIFERGFGKHTGLGLFLVREVLALTGITITENGTPGKGARFIITVPEGEFRITSGR